MSLLILSSCQKNDINSNCQKKTNYNFIADFSPVEYENYLEDSIQVSGVLDIDRGLIIKRTGRSEYWTGCFVQPMEDSIFITSSLSYGLKIDDVNLKKLNIEFYYLEAKDNLNSINDSLYSYYNHEVLYNRLNTQDWGEKTFFSAGNCQSFGVSFPDAISPWGDSSIKGLYNYGFYLDFENMSFDKLNYIPDLDQINFDLTFNVSIKILSCGYYEFFRIENAHLKSVINPCLNE